MPNPATYILNPTSLDPSKFYTLEVRYYPSPTIQNEDEWSSVIATDIPAITPIPVTDTAGNGPALQTVITTAPSFIGGTLESPPLNGGGASATPTSGQGETGTTPITKNSIAPTASVLPASAIPDAIQNGALSTGAKVGIAVGAVAFVLLFVFIALLVWHLNGTRKTRSQRLAYGPGAGMLPYTHDRGTDRDLTVEKEMNVISHFHHTDTGFSDLTPAGVAAGEIGQARGSWTDSPPALGAGTGAEMGMGGPAGPLPQHYPNGSPEPYRDSPYMSPVQAQALSHSPPQQVSAPTPPREFGSELAPLQEPGMSAEELARLEEEERRLDEAIAEAERRQRGGSDDRCA
jgi:hypothetical protein